MSIGVAASEIIHLPGTPRSPRFSVASTGSPIVVDGEISASPKVGRVEFFDRPQQLASGDGVIVEEQQVVEAQEEDSVMMVLTEVDANNKCNAIEESNEHHPKLNEAATPVEATPAAPMTNDFSVADGPTDDHGDDARDELEQGESEPETAPNEPVVVPGMPDGGEPSLDMEEQMVVAEPSLTAASDNDINEEAEAGDIEVAAVEGIQEQVTVVMEEAPVEALPTSNAVGTEGEAVMTGAMNIQEEKLEQSVQPPEESNEPHPVVSESNETLPVAIASLDDTTTATDGGGSAALPVAESDQPLSSVSSTPSTPRRPTRATAAKTPATAAKAIGKAMGAASEPRRGTRSTTTPAKTPATSRVGKRTRGAQLTDKDNGDDEQQSQVSGGRAASARRSTRKTLAAKTPVPPSTGKRAAGQTTEEYSEGDSASPSYRSRGKPGRAADVTATSLGSADDTENAHPNKIPRRQAGSAPAKQVVVEIAPTSDSPADSEESSRRRSTRARTPAKAQ